MLEKKESMHSRSWVFLPWIPKKHINCENIWISVNAVGGYYDSFRVLMLDSERVWVRRGLLVGNARQWTIGGDSGEGGITALSDLSVVGEVVVLRRHDRRTMLPLRSTPDPLAHFPP